MARKMIMIAAVAATLVTAVAPVTAMAQDRYRDGDAGYSRQYGQGDWDRGSYDRDGGRSFGWIAHERHERWEREQARRRYWQHERWERQNEGRHGWNHDQWDHRDRYHDDDDD